MENQDSHFPAKVQSQDQSKSQTSVQAGKATLEDSILGFCSLKDSNGESVGSQMSPEESPATRREVRKLGSVAGAAQPKQEGKPSRERDSSVDSNSSRVAPHSWGTQSNGAEEDEDEIDFSRASLSAPLDGIMSSPQPRRILTAVRGNREFVDRSKYPESSDQQYVELRETAHRAYWAELQNQLPLPLANLMEEEALEILTKSLHSYSRGIGKDHKLTQQLRRHVEQLLTNLKSRKCT
ncbi:cation channel sperm-associated auxiliary subunit zeta [Phascolarctos cinereus]|uniref:Testis-expressed protein 40 n=1 Tax=Phascolarctos cinereus TaxID=38626 RepID=A0A6P5IYI3_PHACI|nr:testis-expressed protein 40 [Phascolarctos cinereus]